MNDWSGHVPQPENWQIQFGDGSVVSVPGEPSDFATGDEARQQAAQWSEDWQVSLIVKQTS